MVRTIPGLNIDSQACLLLNKFLPVKRIHTYKILFLWASCSNKSFLGCVLDLLLQGKCNPQNRQPRREGFLALRIELTAINICNVQLYPLLLATYSIILIRNPSHKGCGTVDESFMGGRYYKNNQHRLNIYLPLVRIGCLRQQVQNCG